MHRVYRHHDARPLKDTVSSPALPWSLPGQVSLVGGGGETTNPMSKGRPSENGLLDKQADPPRGLAWTCLHVSQHTS